MTARSPSTADAPRQHHRSTTPSPTPHPEPWVGLEVGVHPGEGPP